MGAYFTTLSAETPNLAKFLRMPKRKLEYFFSFQDIGDLQPLRGGRGDYTFYSVDDYLVPPERQESHGLMWKTGEAT